MPTKINSLKFEIYQNSVWTEYEIFDNKLKITQQIDLFEGKIKDTIVDLGVKYDNSLYNYLIQNKYVNARIYINNTIVFSGYIEVKFKVIRNTKLPDKIDLNIIGFYNKLRKKYKIIKKYTSKTPAYIINDLLSITNLSLYSTPSGLSNITLTKTFDLSTTTPAEIIEKILFECGYTGYEKTFNNQNYLFINTIKQNLPTSYTYKENIVEDSNYQIVNEVILMKELNDIDEVSIKYYDLQSFSNQILFEDTTNQNSIYRCYIAISPNSYYQDNTAGVYLDLTYNKDNKSFEIFDLTSATLDIQKDSDIEVVESYLTENNRYFVKIRNNNTTTTKYVYKLQVKGTGTVKKNINFQKIDISDGDTKKEYEMKYIQSSIKSQNLCDSLAHLYKYSNYKVTFDCFTHSGLFSKCKLDSVKGLGTINCITTKIVINYELNKNIVYDTENYLIGDVITYTTNQETIINSNSIVNEISNNQQISTTQQTLIGNVEDINFTDEDNDDVILRLKIYINSLGEKYLAIVKVYKDTGTIKEFANLRIKNLELMDGKILANTIANTTEINLRNLDDTDFIGLDAKYYKIQDTEVIKKNTNNEVEADVNKLIATKEFVYGADGQSTNWITNTTPILRQRDSTNTEYYYLVINTKIIASNYTSGSNTMFDIILKTYCLSSGGSNWYNSQQMQVRFTGYIYYSGSTYTIYKFRAHILGSNHYNIYAGAYVDSTSGYLHLFLYSPDQYFSTYYRYSEVFFNNYYFAKKSYIDNWSISYADSITGYDTNYGIMYAKTGGEVMSYDPSSPGILIATITIAANSNITRYFSLYRSAIISALPQSIYVDCELYSPIVGLMICSYSTSKKDTIEFLPAGRYKIYAKNTFSSSSFDLYIYANNIQGIAPSSVISSADIISSLSTTW